MKRYFLSKIVGKPGSRENGWRPKVADTPGVNVASIMPTDEDGRPLFPWALCVLSGPGLPLAIAQADAVALPDVTFDAALSSIKPATWVAFAARAKTLFGVNPSELVSASGNSADGFRDLVRQLGARLQPGFDENALDVGV